MAASTDMKITRKKIVGISEIPENVVMSLFMRFIFSKIKTNTPKSKENYNMFLQCQPAVKCG